MGLMIARTHYSSKNVMILYEGKYSWDGTKTDDEPPVSWWPGSYNIKIIDLRASNPGVIHLKPYLCLFSEENSQYSVKERFHNLAVKICKKYDLDPEKVMWIESFSDGMTKLSDIAVIEKITTIGNEIIYKTNWRQVRPNEEAFIARAVEREN